MFVTPWRAVAVLALPVALQTLLQALLGMADVAMVTGLGEKAVAAVGLAAKLHFLLLVLMIGMATAGSVLIAQHTGAGDANSSRRTLLITLVAGAALSLPFTLIFASGKFWLMLINPDAEVVRLAALYLLITAPVVILTQCITTYEGALRSTGNTFVPLAFGAGSVLLNVLLNYLLIFGHHGFPELGVEGAAWGTVIARSLQLLAMLGWLYGKKHSFALKPYHLIELKRAGAVRHFCRFALPLVVNHAVWGIGNATYHIATGYAGTAALAVMGVMVPIESVFFALFVGLANACAVMVGQSLGAGQDQRAWQLHRLFDRLAIALVVALALALWFARPWLLATFRGLDAETAVLMMNTLTVFCLCVWVKIANMMRILGVLRAGGDNRFCLVTDTIVMWLVGVPIFIVAVWAGAPFLLLYALMFVEDALKFLPVQWRLKKRYWMKNLSPSHSLPENVATRAVHGPRGDAAAVCSDSYSSAASKA